MKDFWSDRYLLGREILFRWRATWYHFRDKKPNSMRAILRIRRLCFIRDEYKHWRHFRPICRWFAGIFDFRFHVEIVVVPLRTANSNLPSTLMYMARLCRLVILWYWIYIRAPAASPNGVVCTKRQLLLMLCRILQAENWRKPILLRAVGWAVWFYVPTDFACTDPFSFLTIVIVV